MSKAEETTAAANGIAFSAGFSPVESWTKKGSDKVSMTRIKLCYVHSQKSPEIVSSHEFGLSIILEAGCFQNRQLARHSQKGGARQ